MLVSPSFFATSITVPLNLSNVALSVSTTLVATLLIAIRIFSVSRVPGASRRSLVGLEIIVESAALYSIAGLLYIAFVAGIVEERIAASLGINYAEVVFAYMAVSFQRFFPFLFFCPCLINDLLSTRFIGLRPGPNHA
jgi:hypothetical protein